MATGIFLEDNPPARTQFRRTRRAPVTGAIVVHTAENTTDTTLPDGGAEAVARFISTRRDAAGSYHTVVDSDSIVDVGRYEWEMFHEGTGGNRFSLGLSFACQASQWPTLPNRWVDGALKNGGLEAATMAAWVKSTRGIDVPARRITAAQYRAGQPGFIGHGDLDPGRRSDPGAQFPWSKFFERYVEYAGGEVPVADHCVPGNRKAVIENSQRLLADEGFYTGGIDADWFNGSSNALIALNDDRKAAIAARDSSQSEIDDLRSERDALQASLDGANSTISANQILIAQLQTQLDDFEGLDREAAERLVNARDAFISFGSALGLKIEAADDV